MKKIISNPLIPFENKWVALTTDRKKVVASGRTIRELDKNLIKQRIKNVVLTKVLPFDQVLSP